MRHHRAVGTAVSQSLSDTITTRAACEVAFEKRKESKGSVAVAEGFLLLRPSPPTERASRFFNQRGNLLRPGDVDRVAGACDFDLAAFRSCGIPAFKVGVDGSVVCR